MDINALSKINSVSLVEAYNKIANPSQNVDHSGFDSLLSKAMDTINTTNSYINAAKQEEVKWALGESTSTHDLTNAMQKSSVAMQYTITIRDKVLDAYKEIMQMQI
jgi:flagellar hook-basal body complex protein FliE